MYTYLANVIMNVLNEIHNLFICSDQKTQKSTGNGKFGMSYKSIYIHVHQYRFSPR